MYLLDELQRDFQIGKKLKYLFFWGHQAAADGSITKSCLSQWWQCHFTIDEITYNSAEQYMMAEKARLFHDHEMLEQILASNHPKQAKALGRKVARFNQDIWASNCYNIVTRGNLAKFSQNKQLASFLLDTKNRVLVEASPVDTIWGVGMSSDHESIENPMLWKGQNLLGFALMDVRQTLMDLNN